MEWQDWDCWVDYSFKSAIERKVFGGREGDRTLDLSVANAALSHLSYSPTRQEQDFLPLSASWVKQERHEEIKRGRKRDEYLNFGERKNSR
jgi:hypothetical protein